MTNIGKRLRQVREAKGLSQGDIERRTGLLRCYVCRVECGHTVPQLENLEKWAAALGVTMSKLFSGSEILPVPAKPAKRGQLRSYEERLLRLVERLDAEDKRLLVLVARKMVEEGGKHGRKG